MSERKGARSRRLQAEGQRLANPAGPWQLDEQLEEERRGEPELLTAQEVARSARLVPETVQRACKRGEIQQWLGGRVSRPTCVGLDNRCEGFRRWSVARGGVSVGAPPRLAVPFRG
jgi:hypothetical protein